MALESATYIGDLVTTNPTASDLVGQGDDHLRLLKAVLQNTFPNFTTTWNKPTSKDSAYSVSAGANSQLYYSSASATTTVSFNLPPSASLTAGWTCYFRTIGTGMQLLNRAGTDTVNGQSTFQVPQKTKCTLMYLGSGAFFAETFPTNESGTSVFSGTLAVAGGASFSGTIVSSGLLKLDGGQIAFPASQNASANANTLDDYEEGTFTPGISCAVVGNLSPTYTNRLGFYTKVGNLVWIDLLVDCSAITHTTATGQISLTGLPFTVQNTTGISSSLAISNFNNFTFTVTQMTPFAEAIVNTTTVTLSRITITGNRSSGASVTMDGNHTTGESLTIRVSGNYLV